MRIIIAMLILAGASASLEAGEIKRYETVTIKGMLGTHSDPKEDGFRITITNNDVVVPGSSDADGWSDSVPASIPVKSVAIFVSEDDPRYSELKKTASRGETVALRGSFRIWERHLKLGRSDVLLFELAP